MPSVIANEVTASTTATMLCDGQTRRRNLTFTNNGAVTVYIGPSDVTTSAFFRALEAGDVLEFTRGAGGEDPSAENRWYGITASSTASVAVGEVLA